jgi:hypothetical protein
MNSKKDWLNTYGNKSVRKFQMGGPMEGGDMTGAGPQAGAAPEAPGGNLDAMLAEYAQSRDPQLAVQICDMLVELIASQGGGAGAPAEGPAMARNGAKMSKKAPVFRA